MNNLNIFFNKNHEMVLNNDVSLQAVVSKVVEYLNGLIDRENELLNMFNELKTETNTSITDLTTALSEFVKTEKNNYLIFEQEMLDSLVEYKNETDKEITEKSNEVDESLANIDLTSAVSDYFTSQLSTTYFTNLYNDIKATAYILTYYGATPPTITINGSYWYNTTNNKLYYNLGTTQEVELSPNSFYYYNGKLYIPIKENDVYVLREVNANE